MPTKFNLILIRLFFFLIFISVTSVAYLLLPDTASLPPPLAPPRAGGEMRTTTPTVILRPKAEESIKANNDNNTGYKGSFANAQDDKVSAENFQTATLAINDKKYSLQFKTGENLLTAMRRLADTGQFSFSGRDYGSLGFFVEEINGLKNSPANNQYWVYYINSQSATVGISLYILKLNDLIKWQYVANKF